MLGCSEFELVGVSNLRVRKLKKVDVDQSFLTCTITIFFINTIFSVFCSIEGAAFSNTLLVKCVVVASSCDAKYFSCLLVALIFGIVLQNICN